MSRWSDAAFEQERLLGTVKFNPNFRDYLSSYQDAAYPEFPAGMMLKLHEHLLQEADPMYVSMEVTELWDYARDSFEPEVLHPWDLPAPIVFAMLPRPLIMKDAEDNVISFRAVSWTPAGQSEKVGWSQDEHADGVWYTLWSHIDDNDDFDRQYEMHRESWEALGQWSILFSGFLPFGKVENYEFSGGFRDFDDPEKVIDVRRKTWLLLQSFWRLSRQLVPVKELLPRQLRRDRKRHYRSEEVTVIQLRRHKHPLPDDHEPGDVDWKYQWVVRGHWRQQWYPKVKEHRQIWISPYMKGPEDAPIKPVKRAFEFTR